MKHSRITARPTFSFTTYVYRGKTEREYPVEVTYTVTPGTPARLYGDYPHPEEPAEVEVLTAVVIGDTYPLTTDEWDRIQSEAEEASFEDMADYAADYAEYRAELRRDAA